MGGAGEPQGSSTPFTPEQVSSGVFRKLALSGHSAQGGMRRSAKTQKSIPGARRRLADEFRHKGLSKGDIRRLARKGGMQALKVHQRGLL
jgi:hypothetical protein